MVDYSRWDKLDLSDDEDQGQGKPRVHAFKGPQQVTIGGADANGQVIVSPSPALGARADVAGGQEDDDDEPVEPMEEDVADAEATGDHREDVLQMRALAERALRQGDPHEAVRLLEKAMRFGGAVCPGLEDVLASARRQAETVARATSRGDAAASLAPAPSSVVAAVASSSAESAAATGGVVDGRYVWSQTRDTVEVSVFVQDGTKAKSVAVEVSERRVLITAAGERVLDGEWEFKVAPEDDPDWEVRDDPSVGRRVVRLTVRKAPMPGGLSVVVWWKRLLMGEPEIDLGKIEGRKRERTESFAKAWKEAHLQFRESASQRTRIPVDVGGDAMDD